MTDRKILIRFDDICPTMDWKQWGKATRVLDKYGVKPLIGVVPDNIDPDLQKDDPRLDFWEYVKELQNKGYTVAMHGYQHVLDSKSSGLVTNRKASEFAGLSYEAQYEKINSGKTLLNGHGIYTNIFFAPAHSYDENTLKALSECGFKYISDGKTLQPVIRNGIICVPCLDGGCPRIKNRKAYTAVFHTSEWNRQDKKGAYDDLIGLINNHRNEIVSFNDYYIQPSKEMWLNNRYEQIILFYDFYLRNTINKLKHTVKIMILKIMGK